LLEVAPRGLASKENRNRCRETKEAESLLPKYAENQ